MKHVIVDQNLELKTHFWLKYYRVISTSSKFINYFNEKIWFAYISSPLIYSKANFYVMLMFVQEI